MRRTRVSFDETARPQVRSRPVAGHLSLCVLALSLSGAAPIAAQETLEAGFSPYMSGVSVTGATLRADLLRALQTGPNLESERVGELLEGWRAHRDGPSSGQDWLLVARLWRQAGVPDSAFEALRRAARSGGAATPGLLSLEVARTAFLADRPDVGAETYWGGCRRADRVVLEEYWRDFAAVATPEEAAEWERLKALASPSEARDSLFELLRRAWGERAAAAGLSVEDRLALHYERLRHARRHYALSRERMRLGPTTRLLSTRVGRPDEAGLDDRGLIYVRLGEPDRRTGFLGVESASRRAPRQEMGSSRWDWAWARAARALEISDECYHPNESWAYDYPDGTRVYHFSPLEGSSEWWLLENLSDVYRCGDPSAAVTISRGALGVVEASVATLSPAAGQRRVPPEQVAWLVLADLYRSRSGLDPGYGALAHQMVSAGPQSTAHLRGLLNVGPGAMQTQSQLAEERQTNAEVVEAALTDVPDRPAVDASAPLLFELLQFRVPGRRGDLTRLWANAALEGKRLRGERTDGGLRYRVRAALRLVSQSGEMLERQAEFSLVSPRELGSETGVPVRVALDVPPGEYAYSLVLTDSNDEGDRPTGNWRSGSLRVRDYGASLPQLSDVAFAPDSGRGWNPAPEVSLPVSPVHRTDGDARAWLYFEAYGLSPAGDYVMEVRLEPEGQGEPFALTYAGARPDPGADVVRRVLRLDLADTEPGEYVVRFTVTDAAGNRSLPLRTSLTVDRG